MHKDYTYEVTGRIEFKDSFDWQAQADEWWHGDVDLMQEELALFMFETGNSADRWEGAVIPDDAAVLADLDWTHESTVDAP